MIRWKFIKNIYILVGQSEKNFQKIQTKTPICIATIHGKPINAGFHNGYSLTDKNLNEKKVSLLSKISQKMVEN